MTAPARPAHGLDLLSDAALQQMSGPVVFARGQTYASSGAMEELQTPALAPGEQAALEAVVQGTQTYHVRVSIQADDRLDGACDCPHAQDGHFCKHLVALCLTWRGELGGTAPAHDPEAAKKVAAAAQRARTQASNQQTLRRFVQGQSAEALAERLWAWAENDRDRMAELKAWAIEHRAAGDPKALRGAITELLRNRSDYLDWRESGAYAHRAAKVLPLLRSLLERDPAQLRELCEHALRCLYKVAEHADDSNGEVGGLMQDLMGLLGDALRAAPPAAAWVERWWALMADDPWGLWDEKTILAAAGPAVQARYAARACQDWQDWQSRHPPATAPGAGRRVSDSHDGGERRQLRRRYLDSLSLQDDPLALRGAMAESAQLPHEFVELVALCEDQGWFREALQWAETGAKRHPNDWRCESDLLRCYERDGWDDEALAIWRRRLQARPDVETYRAVLKAAERAGRDRAAYRAELFAWAEQCAQAQQDAERKRTRPHPGTPVPHSVDVRVHWHLAEGEPEHALALVQQAGASGRPDTLETLARQLPAKHHAAAVQLLQRVFGPAMARASSPYSKPLALVRDILARMPPAQQAAWLASLRAEYKPKRNFIAGLP